MELQNAEELAVNLRKILTEVPKVFDYNGLDINQCDKETQDLLHLIELTSFDACKGYKLTKELKDVRLKRRALKDQNELLEPLVEVVKKMKSFENDINKCIGEIRRRMKNHETRGYKMRVREDLQEAVSSSKNG